MSAPATPACALGLSADDLSAWRDHTLAPEAERRITAHASGCPACQRTIAAHEALATALQAEQPPAPDPRNWPRLQARISDSWRRAPAMPTLRRAQRHAVWGGLSAAAAVLLISALFFHLFTQQAGLRGGSSHHKNVVAATPPALLAVAPTTPIVGQALDWQTRMAPESVIPPPGNQTYNNGFAFSPTDANTAYICATTNAINAPNTIWATHDGAKTWTHVGDIPYAGEVASCAITVDAADPLRLNVILSQQSLTLQSLVTNEISDDGGKTWRTLSDDVQLIGLVTRGSVSIAVASPWDSIVNANAKGRPWRLSLSRDDWRTWQPIDGALAAQGLIVEKVWSRPGDGALLVEAAASSTPTTPTATGAASTHAPISATYIYSLWQSVDLGAHWTPLPTPPNLIAIGGFVVAQPQGNAAWQACGFAPTGSGATQSELIGCTADGGQTWTARPLPALKQSCGAGCLQQQTPGEDGSALGSDGSLITTFFAGPTDPTVAQTLSMFHIFRLAPGASAWQDLGSQPGNALVMLGAPPTGTLVSFSGGSTLDGLGGELVGHLGGDVPNRGALAFATLP